MTYKTAITRIEEIVKKIEAEEPDIDELGSLIKEAHGLMEFCRTKLKGTEEEVEAALLQIKQGAQ